MVMTGVIAVELDRGWFEGLGLARERHSSGWRNSRWKEWWIKRHWPLHVEGIWTWPTAPHLQWGVRLAQTAKPHPEKAHQTFYGGYSAMATQFTFFFLLLLLKGSARGRRRSSVLTLSLTFFNFNSLIYFFLSFLLVSMYHMLILTSSLPQIFLFLPFSIFYPLLVLYILLFLSFPLLFSIFFIFSDGVEVSN